MHQAQTCCDCKPTSPCTNASPCSIFASHVLQGLPEASASGSRRAKSEPVYLHHVTTVRGADNSHGSAPVLLRQKTPASTATANRAGRMRGRPALSCHDRCRPDTHYRAGRLHCCNFSRCTLHLLQMQMFRTRLFQTGRGGQRSNIPSHFCRENLLQIGQ